MKTRKAATVNATAFNLLDSTGRVRARLSVQSGAPVLIMKDTADKTRIKLTVRVDGPSFALYDGKIKRARARVDVRRGVPRVEITDVLGNIVGRTRALPALKC
jgi:hypothetical protein